MIHRRGALKQWSAQFQQIRYRLRVPSRRCQSTKHETTTPGNPSGAPVESPALSWHQKLGPVSQFIEWFHRTQGRRPLTVQLCTSSTVYFCGDILAQNIGGEPYDPIRTLRMLTIGAVASIPGYKWFMFLGRNFNYASKWRSIATKVVVQQAVFTPIFNSYFFGMQAVLTGQPFSGVVQRIQDTVPTSIINSCKVWPVVTALTFAFVMPQYRFMASGVVAVVWQSYLSYLNRKSELLRRAEAEIAVVS